MDNSNYQDGGQLMTDEELKQQIDSMSNDEVLDVIMKSLLIEKGFTNLDEETESKMIADLKERAIDMINFSIIDALPDEKAAEIAEKAEASAEDAADAAAEAAETITEAAEEAKDPAEL